MPQTSQNIVFTDLVSFVAFELDEPAALVRRTLWEEPARLPQLLDRLGQSDLFLWRPVAAEPIYFGDPKKGSALVEAKVELHASYLTRLVEKQAKSANHAVGPIAVELSSGVLSHYREKISHKMEALLSDVRQGTAGGVGGVHRLLEASADLRCVQEYFDEIVTNLLQNRDMIQTIVLALSDGGTGPGLKKGINAALVAMAILALYPQLGAPETRRRELTELGTAAVLQDISLLADTGAPGETHCERSAEIAAQRGASWKVTDLIRLHHTLKSSAGRPVLENPDALGEQAKVLVVTNVYLGMIDEDGAGTALEFMKRLSYLAKGKYVDNVAVEVLYKICLPSLKACVLEGADKIGKSCPEGASTGIPWPVAGDRVPSIFICRNDACTVGASQTVSLAKNLPFVVDGKTITTITRGDYQVCSLLSGKLKTLHASVQSQLPRTG